jgi:hypothetical protein
MIPHFNGIVSSFHDWLQQTGMLKKCISIFFRNNSQLLRLFYILILILHFWNQTGILHWKCILLCEGYISTNKSLNEHQGSAMIWQWGTCFLFHFHTLKYTVIIRLILIQLPCHSYTPALYFQLHYNKITIIPFLGNTDHCRDLQIDQNSTVSTVTCYGLEGSGFEPWWKYLPDWPYGPPSLLCSGYQGYILRIKWLAT